MQPRVIVVVVARDDATRIDDCLAALAGQTRPPDEIVLADAGSVDGTAERLADGGHPVAQLPELPFPAALERVVRQLHPEGSDWLWMLPGDAVPEPDALQRLLGAAERSPSVAIAGPKLVAADDPTRLVSFGESLSRFGATVPLAEDEFDQAQHDRQDDVLGVALPGALVRHAMWTHLGGPDRGLPTADAGLDLSIRARLAGARVVRVPDARIAVTRRPDETARRTPRSRAGRHREARRAELHRRLVAARGPALVLHWLALVPLGLLRAVGMLVAKRPALALPELAASFQAAFDGSVPAARRALRRRRKLPWSALAPLRVPPEVVRERRAFARDGGREPEPELVRAPFVPGGLAVVLGAAVVGVVLQLRQLGGSALAGGALGPLADVATLWSRTLWGERDALGLLGPADPFHWVLAVAGSAAFWQPSLALVVLWAAAPGLAALGAWWCATRFSSRAWPPAVAAIVWALAPPLLAALVDGRPAAVVVHVLAPFLLLAVIDAARSWSAAGAAALLFAAVTAASPVLAPALLLGVIGWAAARPRGMVRILGIPLVAAALAAPLVVAQLRRGTPIGLLADPGPQVASTPPSGWQLVLGIPSADSPGWSDLGLGEQAAVLLPAALLVPLAALALVALLLPGARRALPAAALVIAGLATAVLAAHLGVALDGPDVVTPWPGAPLSLAWLGLVCGAAVGLDALRRFAPAAGLVAAGAAVAAVTPLAIAPVLGLSAVHGGDGRSLPALVVAEGERRPGTGTLVLDPRSDGSLVAEVVRGSGRTLDAHSTYPATATVARDAEREIAVLAGNLVSRGGADPVPALEAHAIEFVVLRAADDRPAGAVRQRAAEALDAAADLVPIGETEHGTLWRAAADIPVAEPAPLPEWAGVLVAGQAVVVLGAAVLALPTGRRRPVRTRGGAEPGEGGDFDEGFDDEFGEEGDRD